jgi:hypothetical protein
MKLPPDAVFHHDSCLMVFRPRGVITEKRVQKNIKMLEVAENSARKPFNRFTDLSKVEAIHLEFGVMFRISLHRRLVYAKHPPVKSAFYVTDNEAARIVKIHAVLTNYSPLRVRMFHDLHAAAKWLDVSVETLELDPWRPGANKQLAQRATRNVKQAAKQSPSERKNNIKHYEYT